MKQKRKTNQGFKELYTESLNYLKESRNFIYFGIFLFFIFAVIGFFFPTPRFISDRLIEMIKELVNQTQGMSQFELTGFIFWNNLTTSFFAIIFGIFFGIPSLAISIFNGYVLGFVASFSVVLEGFFSLWKLLPHGIFELPAVFISLGLGLKLGISLFSNFFSKYFKTIPKLNYFLLTFFSILLAPISFFIIFAFTFFDSKLRKNLEYNFKMSMLIFLFIVIPLLFIAAIIEGGLIVLFD